jgi:F-box and leucine-rich repeat protein GRR1
MVSLYKHHAPSTTSLSDDADDLDNEEDNQLTFYSNHQLVPAQWKHSRLVQRPAAVSSPISTIPQEILIQIFKHLHSSKDIYSALRVSRMWCQCAVELLWHKPSFPKYNTISKMAKLLRKSDSTFTYARFIRRLNFLNHGNDFEDAAFSVFGRCDRLERLTLIGCKNLSGAILAKILPMFSNLVAIDLTGVDNCTSDAIIGLASVASRLQGINISGCKQVTDPGIVALSQQCPLLRRVKLSGLVLITDVAISALATGCPMLLEIDLNGCKLITDVSVRLIWTNLLHMREMRLGHCDKLTDLAFPSPFRVDNDVNPYANAQQREDDLPPLIISRSFDNLRMLDLTACALITDSAVEGLVSHAPKIRNLVLSKCVLLTDKAVEKICRLGRHLHYLHLGHASKISDASVRLLARSCTRIRYIDFASTSFSLSCGRPILSEQLWRCTDCVLLTDMSVFELSALPKLRRVGLVRVNQLTDEAIYALGERHATLERIHLSYCDQISVMAIHFLLLKLHKLTHLSLTGVPSFRQSELQQFCREAPKVSFPD